jgi:hypothetical protein
MKATELKCDACGSLKAWNLKMNYDHTETLKQFARLIPLQHTNCTSCGSNISIDLAHIVVTLADDTKRPVLEID